MGYLSLLIFFAVLMLQECISPPPPLPTDAEMIDHFRQHREAFEQIRTIVEELPYGDHYPPFDRWSDTLCLRGVTPEHRRTLDSLLRVVKCQRIRYYGKELRKEDHRRYERSGEPDTTTVTLSFEYYARGLSIGGTSKDFYYTTQLRPWQEAHLVEEEINDIYARTPGNLICYRRIEEHWYIDFDHDD